METGARVVLLGGRSLVVGNDGVAGLGERGGLVVVGFASAVHCRLGALCQEGVLV